MNKNEKVLALKYRPQTFRDLIGQDVAAATILNSIKANKVPNAYLFTGIRGVGKTTIARIVAKALNCMNGVEKLCSEDFCENCKSIANSNHIDVLEMDAASKTGVDDVRDLIEFSRYGPTSAKNKIFIIDEVHMLSKQAFNALLKTLEEPPQYENGGGLKFIFATTEIKKIPVTVVSRCQRFDLSRVKSLELFEYLKNIKQREKGKVTDEALKLIVKISEGSVRDALSLLDRAMLSLNETKELDLKSAQKIFGCFDKSQLINLFKVILEGNESEALNIYKKIYDQGVEPKTFINDFLEILYYFKNIDALSLESTNFSLNDDEFLKIKQMSKNINNDTLFLFWQFTIKSLEEIDIVSNQNLCMEMFIIRLIHLKAIKQKNDLNNDLGLNNPEKDLKFKKDLKDKDLFDKKDQIKTVDQIKNITQEENQKHKDQKEIKASVSQINSFDDLIKICSSKRELKLKYELEKNVNLVSFENKRIEISFNDNLNKSFVKDLSSKLYEWTQERWIITLSKVKGSLSKKEEELNKKKQTIDLVKKTALFKTLSKEFPDIDLIDVKISDKKKEENDD